MAATDFESPTNPSCIWLCPSCDLPNYSSSILDSSPPNLSNSFSHLLSAPTDGSLGNTPSGISSSDLHINRCNYSPSKQTNRPQAHTHRKDKISVLNVNFQSLPAKRESFLQMINEKKPDIIIGTESWLTSDHNNSEYFPTELYQVERRDRPDDPHGGVLIAAKQDLALVRDTDLETDCELLWCKFQVQGSKTVHIGAYYRPHVSDQHSVDELAKSLELLHPDHTVLLGGDFNFPGWDWKNKTTKVGCPYVHLHHQFGDLLDDHGLEQLIVTPTRGENTLDLMITNNPSRVSRISVLPGLSDHDCPLVKINIRPIRYRQKRREIPLYKKARWDSLRADLQATADKIELNNDSMSVNEMWQEFKDNINCGVKKHIPHKICKSKNNLPWITPAIRRLIRQRDRVNIKRKRARLSHAPTCTMQQYERKMKEIKTKIQRETRIAYWKHVETIITPNEEDPNKYCAMKRFWSFIKHRRSDNVSIPTLKKDGRSIVDPLAKANILNDKFHSVFTRDNPDEPEIPQLPNAYPPMEDIHISKEGVRRLVQGLKVHKAPGPDGISPLVMKELSGPVSTILTTIFNKSYETGEIPEDWKKANVTPVYKKGAKHDPNNYRPISLTCISCKLMEHILASSIMQHARTHNILYSLQHGFRDKRSCETQLLGFVNDLVNSMHSGAQTDILIMDFSKAFDKVSHRLLVRKLQQYGICGKTNLWINNFLNGRTQSVVLEGESSDSSDVLSGVPQGSVLGPCLFLFYINDMPDTLTSNVRLFADDTVVYLTITTEASTQILQNDLDKLAIWERQWKMEFHPEKCEVLRVSRKRSIIHHEYKLHGKALATADSAKYLGVTITPDLRWNRHIDNITNKANRTLGFLKRNLRVSPATTKSTAYYSLVRPTLEYACVAWDPFTKENINKLEMVQRRAARFVLNRYGQTDSVTEMLKELEWESLQTRRETQRLAMMYKIKNGIVDIGKDLSLKSRRQSRHANSQSFEIPPSRTNYHLNSFLPRTIRQWNKLPNSVVEAKTISIFKRNLATNMLD